jgi:hypothetical protein
MQLGGTEKPGTALLLLLFTGRAVDRARVQDECAALLLLLLLAALRQFWCCLWFCLQEMAKK